MSLAQRIGLTGLRPDGVGLSVLSAEPWPVGWTPDQRLAALALAFSAGALFAKGSLRLALGRLAGAAATFAAFNDDAPIPIAIIPDTNAAETAQRRLDLAQAIAAGRVTTFAQARTILPEFRQELGAGLRAGANFSRAAAGLPG